MPHPAARVRHVAAVARYHVNMQVPDRLPGGRASVEADVVAVGPKLRVDLRLDLIDQR